MSYIGINASFIESLPIAILESIPAGLPPPGVTPNFDHPATLLPAIFSVMSILLFSAMASHTVRLYMRAVVLKNWRLDDTTLTLGFFFTFFYLSGCISGSAYGDVGLHLWDIHLDRAIGMPSLYTNYVISISITPALGLVKLTFLIQFYYLFRPLRWLRLFCWIGGSFITFVYAGTNINIPLGVLGLATDLFLIILPIPAVMGLQLALRKKIGVLAVFALGFLAMIGSTMTLSYRILLFQNANITQADPGWLSGYIAIWTQVELLAGITAANMPIVHQFFIRKNIIQRIQGGKFATAIGSLLSIARHNTRGDTYTPTDSFDLHNVAPVNTKMDSEMNESTEWKDEPHSEV